MIKLRNDKLHKMNNLFASEHKLSIPASHETDKKKLIFKSTVQVNRSHI